MTKYYTRADWDAQKNSFPKEYQYQFWPPPLYIATWKEIPLILLTWLAGAVVIVIMFILAMWLLSTIIENAGDRSANYDRCLKQATNGYEIKKCN